MQFYMYCSRNCKYCKSARKMLQRMGLPCVAREVSKKVLEAEGFETYPQVFLRYKGRQHRIGGFDDLQAFFGMVNR